MKSPALFRAARVGDVPSALVALVLTAAAFAAVFVVSANALLFQSETFRAKSELPRETLVYLQRSVTVQPRIESSLRVAAPSRSLQKRDTASPRVTPRPSVSRSHVDVLSPTSKSLAGPTPVFLPPYRAQPRFTPSPFDAPRPRNPFLSEEQRTRAEMDSMLAVLRQGIPLFARTRTPTPAERDSVMRDQARARLVPGREAQVPGTAQMSLSLPFLAPGPSPSERRRDSAANAEYVARLRRLQARVSASRESLRVADSMSRVRIP